MKRIISLLMAVLIIFSVNAPGLASDDPKEDVQAIETTVETEETAESEETPELEIATEPDISPEPETIEESDATGEPDAVLPEDTHEPTAPVKPEETPKSEVFKPEPTGETEASSEPTVSPEPHPTTEQEDEVAPAAVKEGFVIGRGGKTYYYENGQLQTGLVTVGGKMYYCSPGDGHVMKGGTKAIDGVIYYLSKGDGHILKGGWISGSTKKFYADRSGALYTGLRTIGSTRYYFDPTDGHLLKGGWIRIEGEKKYYADKNGKVLYTYLDMPNITGAVRTSSGVKVTWDKVDGAQKYRVYYKTVGGKWKKLGDTASSSFTWTKAGNAAYAFTVQCVSPNGAVLTSDRHEIGLGVTVPLKKLSRYSYFKQFMTDQQLEKAYNVAKDIMAPAVGDSREGQLSWIAYALRMLFESGMSYSQSDPHYNDPYGYFVLGYASCAGCVRATGLCLDLIGISYEHVNENQWTHQWARVKVGSEYWICDAYGLYCGPEPGVRQHPYL